VICYEKTLSFCQSAIQLNEVVQENYNNLKQKALMKGVASMLLQDKYFTYSYTVKQK